MKIWLGITAWRYLDPIADKIPILFLLFAISINLAAINGFSPALIITREIWIEFLDFNARQNNTSATKVAFF